MIVDLKGMDQPDRQVGRSSLDIQIPDFDGSISGGSESQFVAEFYPGDQPEVSVVHRTQFLENILHSESDSGINPIKLFLPLKLN